MDRQGTATAPAVVVRALCTVVSVVFVFHTVLSWTARREGCTAVFVASVQRIGESTAASEQEAYTGVVQESGIGPMGQGLLLAAGRAVCS